LQFGICCGQLLYYPHFVKLYQEKSGNPGSSIDEGWFHFLSALPVKPEFVTSLFQIRNSRHFFRHAQLGSTGSESDNDFLQVGPMLQKIQVVIKSSTV
jgi:hypothetical protein